MLPIVPGDSTFPARPDAISSRPVRCRFCRGRASWWQRVCPSCRTLWSLWQSHRFEGLPAILRQFREAGVGRNEIERFLDADLRGGPGTVRDQMAADMSNQLLNALGQGSEQSSADVKRLRARGGWRDYDRRREE